MRSVVLRQVRCFIHLVRYFNDQGFERISRIGYKRRFFRLLGSNLIFLVHGFLTGSHCLFIDLGALSRFLRAGKETYSQVGRVDISANPNLGA